MTKHQILENVKAHLDSIDPTTYVDVAPILAEAKAKMDWDALAKASVHVWADIAQKTAQSIARKLQADLHMFEVGFERRHLHMVVYVRSRQGGPALVIYIKSKKEEMANTFGYKADFVTGLTYGDYQYVSKPTFEEYFESQRSVLVEIAEYDLKKSMGS